MLEWLEKWSQRRRIVRNASAFARRSFCKAHPTSKVVQLKLRAVEAKRIVFAVILDTGVPHRGRPPHALVAVGLDGVAYQELSLDPKYSLRGIK